MDSARVRDRVAEAFDVFFRVLRRGRGMLMSCSCPSVSARPVSLAASRPPGRDEVFKTAPSVHSGSELAARPSRRCG